MWQIYDDIFNSCSRKDRESHQWPQCHHEEAIAGASRTDYQHNTQSAVSVAPAVTQERMRGMSPSLAASSVTLLVAVLVLGTTSVKADFLDRNFLDNLFSFSGSQSPDYPRLVKAV